MLILNEEQHHITSFKKFVQIIEKRHSPSVSDLASWMYRGHSNKSYKLIPSIGRLLGTERFPEKSDVLRAEQSSFLNFEIKTYPQLKESNRFLLLAVAQHHGLKTRLLDWSLSPLVALFFAVENESKSDGAFFAFKTNKNFTTILRKNESPLDDLKAKYQYLNMPPISPRINAQRGVFQLFNNPTQPLDNEPFLEKFIIPASAKKEIKIDLNNFGISYDTLFPDFDGIAKSINYTVLNENPF